MKKATIRSLMILSLALVMAACGSKTKTFKIPSTVKNDAYGLTGRKARYVYNGLASSGIKNLNYMETAEQANAQYFANFVDGLLTHNEYGVLEKNLAEKVEHNDDFTEFTFTVRDGVKWQTYDGAQYSATVDGVATPQFVVAEDWFTTVKQVCTYANGSELNYLITNFVRGTSDYLAYTYVLQTKIKEGAYTTADTKKIAKDMNKYLKDNCTISWASEHASGDNPVKEDEVAAIASGSKIGVTFDNAKRTVKYSLFQKASYFPTLFTYSTYLPTNKYFIGDKSIGFTGFGNAADKILYCGPYLLKTSTETEIKMVANPEYWNKDNTIIVDQVNYTVLTTSVKEFYTRQEFEAGRIDGFSINYKDGEGWTKYIGEKTADNPRPYENPKSEYVNSRLLDTIGSCYNTNVNMDRVNSGQSKSYCSETTDADVANTALALSLDDVRQAIINATDWELYYEEAYSSLNPDFRQQYKVWSYVPKNFVLDDDGKDYVTNHFFQEILDHNPDKFENLDEVIETYKYGDVSAENFSDAEVRALALKAKQAIQKYNETATTPITFPVKIEMYSNGGWDDDSKGQDTAIINSINMRLNGLASAEQATKANCTDFYVVPTDQIEDSTTAQNVSRAGNYDFAPVLWGWGADYGDPLTYMNTYVVGGDWASIFAFVGQDNTPAFRSVRDANGDITSLQQYNLLEEYGEIVAQGGAETDDINKRFDYFAEAEYKLIYELGIIKPQVNYGQGWSLSVSRTAGYQVPTANYGIASERFVGLYVLDKVMTRQDRQAARAKQDEMKAAYLAEVGGVINIY